MFKRFLMISVIFSMLLSGCSINGKGIRQDMRDESAKYFTVIDESFKNNQDLSVSDIDSVIIFVDKYEHAGLTKDEENMLLWLLNSLNRKVEYQNATTDNERTVKAKEYLSAAIQYKKIVTKE